MKAGTSKYERFRGTPLANGMWGLIHVILAIVILSGIKTVSVPGLNAETVLILIGFSLPYLLVAASQSRG